MLKRGETVSRVQRRFDNTYETFDDGSHILYVNGAYWGATPIGKLMYDFSGTNPAEYELLCAGPEGQIL